MEIYAAFIRAINVGGTGKIAKDELLKICAECGFFNSKTYIQSGNLVFGSKQSDIEIRNILENSLIGKLGKKHEAYIRRRDELESILSANPFKECAPNRVLVHFHDNPIENIMVGVKNQKNEEISTRGCETFIHYSDGMGASKLIVPELRLSTARNINTIEKVLEIGMSVL